MPHLTPAQRVTLKTAIQADPTANAFFSIGDLDGLAGYLNAAVAPAYIVWKTNVPNEDIGDAMNGTEIAGLSSLNMQRLQVLAAYSGGTQNPSRFDRRDAFDRAFSGAGGTITRAALLILWKRQATRFERVFATGTGTDLAPATLAVEGPIGTGELTGL